MDGLNDTSHGIAAKIGLSSRAAIATLPKAAMSYFRYHIYAERLYRAGEYVPEHIQLPDYCAKSKITEEQAAALVRQRKREQQQQRKVEPPSCDWDEEVEPPSYDWDGEVEPPSYDWDGE